MSKCLNFKIGVWETYWTAGLKNILITDEAAGKPKFSTFFTGSIPA